MGYFRSLAVLNEFSKRALDLSSFILQINSAHYTIWQEQFYYANSFFSEQALFAGIIDG